MPKDLEYHLTTDCGSSPCGKRHKFGVLEQTSKSKYMNFSFVSNSKYAKSTRQFLNILKYSLLC